MPCFGRLSGDEFYSGIFSGILFWDQPEIWGCEFWRREKFRGRREVTMQTEPNSEYVSKSEIYCMSRPTADMRNEEMF